MCCHRLSGARRADEKQFLTRRKPVCSNIAHRLVFTNDTLQDIASLGCEDEIGEPVLWIAYFQEIGHFPAVCDWADLLSTAGGGDGLRLYGSLVVPPVFVPGL